MPGDAALGPRRFDFRSIDPLNFEELCFALVRLEFPAAVRVAAPDKGVDVLVPGTDGEPARGFQAKPYVDQISWPECRRSLDAAADGHVVGRLTFCFARDLTAKQLSLFDKHLRARRHGVSVDWWGASELTARMTDTEEGRLVAARFFGDPARDAEAIARAVRAGGALGTADDVLDRRLAIGEFATHSNPHFSYEGAQREAGAAGREQVPGTAVRVERLRDGIASRIEAAPRSREALERFGPRGRLIFQGTEHGTHAHKALTCVVRGGSATLERGAKVALDALPPLLAQLIRLGDEVEATVRVEAKTLQLAVIARAVRDDGSVFELPLILRPKPKPSPDEIELHGHHGGLTMTLTITSPESHRESRLHWRHRLDDSPADDQLATLRFLQAATHGAQFELLTSEDRRVVFAGTAAADEVADWLDRLTALVGAIVTLEQISGETIAIPTEITGAEANSIIEVAAVFNARGVAATWDDFKLVARPEVLPQISVGRNLRVVEQVYARVLGRELHLGEREITLERFQIAKIEPVGEGPDGDLRITCVPVAGDGDRIFMHLRPAVQLDATRT
jgi:hypothetical protein